MIVQSKKYPKNQQELTTQEWDNLKKLGLDKNFKVIDGGQVVTKKAMNFPETLEVEEIKTQPIKKTIKKSI